MRRMAISKLRSNFAEVFNQVAYGKERVIILREGNCLAALVPLDDLRRIEHLEESENPHE